jgi:lipoprotein-releasing system ATP-binding protein
MRRPAQRLRSIDLWHAVLEGLCARPEVTVAADERTGNLDTASADAAFAPMREFGRSRGTAFPIVTHDPRLARRCDRIAELVDGAIVADAPVAAAAATAAPA